MIDSRLSYVELRFITHSNDKVWVTLNEEFGEVTSVEVGVTFLNEEDYDWPI